MFQDYRIFKCEDCHKEDTCKAKMDNHKHIHKMVNFQEVISDFKDKFSA